MLTLLLTACAGLSMLFFAIAMLMYGLVLLRSGRPVSYFELNRTDGSVGPLARKTRRVWDGSIALALTFGAGQMALALVSWARA